MNQDNEKVVSVFGTMTRREMLRCLAMSGLAIGLSGSGLFETFAAGRNDVTEPPKEIGGTPFRPIKRFQSLVDDKLDIKTLQKNGEPRPRRRDTSWFDKPSNSVGVSLLQFTNTPTYPLNSCAQAACATLLNFYKKAPAGLTGDAITDKIYSTHPPNGGERGTSFTFTVKMIGDYGLKTWAGRSNELGEEVILQKMKTWVSQGQPCVVLLDMKYPQKMPETMGMLGHFVVVFAYTDTHVFMTNWNYKKMGGWLNDWDTFKKSWSLPSSQNHHLLATGWV